MADFTFLFIVILILLALQMQQPLVAVGLFVLLVFTARSKILLIASIVGTAVAALYFLGGTQYTWLVVIGLFIVLIAIARTSPPDTGPEMYQPY